jgi:hypothetical protein
MKTAPAVIARTALNPRCALLCIGDLVRPARADAPVATQTQPAAATLFQNVRIFDGKGGQLSAASNVTVIRSQTSSWSRILPRISSSS